MLRCVFGSASATKRLMSADGIRTVRSASPPSVYTVGEALCVRHTDARRLPCTDQRTLRSRKHALLGKQAPRLALHILCA